MPGSIIRQLRENKGLKQEQMAQQLGISQAAFSKIENNITKLTVKYCKVLSRILGVNVYDYFEDDFEIVRHDPESDAVGVDEDEDTGAGWYAKPNPAAQVKKGALNLAVVPTSIDGNFTRFIGLPYLCHAFRRQDLASAI